MDTHVPPIVVKGPEKWKGVESLARVRELELAGMKRQAIARIFGVSLETLRNAEKRKYSASTSSEAKKDSEEWRAALKRFMAQGVRGVHLSDEALSRDSIYEGRG